MPSLFEKSEKRSEWRTKTPYFDIKLTLRLQIQSKNLGMWKIIKEKLIKLFQQNAEILTVFEIQSIHFYENETPTIQASMV